MSGRSAHWPVKSVTGRDINFGVLLDDSAKQCRQVKRFAKGFFLLAKNNPDQLATARMRGVQLNRPSTINGRAVEAAAVERPQSTQLDGLNP